MNSTPNTSLSHKLGMFPPNSPPSAAAAAPLMTPLRTIRYSAANERPPASLMAGDADLTAFAELRPVSGEPGSPRDLNAFVISTCKKWEGMNSKLLCKNCGLRNLHTATDCNKPRSADLPCQHCYGLDFASAPHYERDCQGCSEVNRPLYQRLKHLFFQKRVNGTYQAPVPATAPIQGAAGNGGP